jgi:NADH-quinone oxidoreductase subunit H
VIRLDLPFILQCAKFLLVFVPLALIPINIFLERKGASLIQDRIGPNRANIPILGGIRLFGMVQNAVDGIKLFTKESFVPRDAHRFWYRVAPMIPMGIALLTPSVIPWFAPLAVEGARGVVEVSGQILDTDSGILLFFAFSGLSVYGVVLGSWASNSKFSLLGGMRASSQMISYEVAMGLSAAGIFLLAGSFSLTRIVEWQGSNPLHWGIVLQPVGFVLFLVSLFAETGRAPFDMAEGDSELVAGYVTEFSAMRFALYYMGEYAHIAIASALVATLFLGGYHVPFVGTEFLRSNLGYVGAVLLAVFGLLSLGLVLAVARWQKVYAGFKPSNVVGRALDHRVMEISFGATAVLLFALAAASALFLHPAQVQIEGQAVWPLWVNLGAAAVQIGTLVAKILFFCWVFVWVRWTLPRFRYDQIMHLGWKILLNIALVNLLVTALVAKLAKG